MLMLRYALDALKYSRLFGSLAALIFINTHLVSEHRWREADFTGQMQYLSRLRKEIGYDPLDDKLFFVDYDL
jgi:hypothetical protein